MVNSISTTVIGDIALVVAVSVLLGTVGRRLGQPAVIGQMLTGLLLGPSLLGQLPGHFTRHQFPPGVLPALTTLAQVGVVIFMFTVGYEIDYRSLRSQGRTVPLIAGSALLTPDEPGDSLCAGLQVPARRAWRSAHRSLVRPVHGRGDVNYRDARPRGRSSGNATWPELPSG